MSLSDKKERFFSGKHKNNWFYPEKDLKASIKRIKEEIKLTEGTISKSAKKWKIIKIIDKEFGDLG